MPSHTIRTERLPIDTVDVEGLLIDDPDLLVHYNEDTYTTLAGEATHLARPSSELEVAALVAWANARAVPVTIIGRKTGLTGGATPLGRQERAGPPPSQEDSGRAGRTGRAGSSRTGKAGKASKVSTGKASSGKASGQMVLALSTEQLTELHVDVAARRATVGPGVLQGDLWRACAEAKGPDAPHGLLYPPDPTSRDDASVGGGVACNASGARTFNYGPTRDWVTGLRVVLPCGEVLALRRGEVTFGPDDRVTIEIGSGDWSGRGIGDAGGWEGDGGGSAPLVLHRPGYLTPRGKNATGYHSRPGMDLIDLFIGEEGTLGVITQVEVRLADQPAGRFQLLVGFNARKAALEFVTRVRDLPETQRPAAIEWADFGALELVAQHQPRHLFFPVDGLAVILVIEVELRPGPDAGTDDPGKSMDLEAMETLDVLRDQRLEEWAGLLEAHDPQLVLTAVTSAQIERFRQTRHAVASTVNELLTFRGVPKLSTDTRVPWERLAEYLDWIYSRIEAVGLEVVSYGHVGDGHVHFNLIARDQTELERAREVYHAMVLEAVSRGGVVSAEHGIGKTKVEFLRHQLGDIGLEGMRRVKSALDPMGILAPGNLFPRAIDRRC